MSAMECISAAHRKLIGKMPWLRAESRRLIMRKYTVQAGCAQHVTSRNAGVPIAELDTPL